MTLRDDHDGLPEVINELTEALFRVGRDVNWPSVGWAPDNEFLDFVSLQAQSLAHAKDEALARYYREAFNTIRTAFEGYFLLQLISRCYLYTREYKIKRTKGDHSLEEARNKFKAQINQKQIRIYKETADTITLVFKGIRVVDENNNDTGIMMPIYYHAWKEYRPFEHHVRGRHRSQSLDTSKFLQGEWAISKNRGVVPTDRTQSNLYRRFFNFDRVLENLRLNKVINKKLSVRILVHYNFLSGFTHTTYQSLDSFPKPNLSDLLPSRDTSHHYNCELALLYACHLSAMYLNFILSYFVNIRHVTIKDIEAYKKLLQKVEQHFGYFWFIFNKPHEYDKYAQANRKSDYRNRKIFRPGDIRSSDVRYYEDPLHRLRNLHCTQPELSTGNVFTSPFPRSDAR